MKRFFCLTAAAALLCLGSGCRSRTVQAPKESDSSAQISDSATQSAESYEDSSLCDDSSHAAVSDIGQSASTAQEILANPISATADFSAYSNTKKGWGQGTIVDSQNRPTGCTDFNQKYGKYNAIYVGPDNGKIYLTFDEGYENGYTSQILDVLKEKSVSGLFFVTYDYAKANPDLIRRMIEEGHIVGNHSTNHPSMPGVSTEKAISEIATLHDYILQNFGYTMVYFRPPMGEFSERTLKITQELGYKSVFWSFAYVDWNKDKQPDPTAATKKITNAAHTGGIFLLHAVSKTNTEILGTVIDSFREKGFDVANFDL